MMHAYLNNTCRDAMLNLLKVNNSHPITGTMSIAQNIIQKTCTDNCSAQSR